jgi:hypothetical protein
MEAEGARPSDPPVTRGRCHCGTVGWSFRGPIPDATICNCNACRRYGALWAYGHVEEEITIDDPEAALTPYSHGSPSLAFNFCRICGNLVSWRGLRPMADGRTRTAVNLRLAVVPDAVAKIPLQRFDGLHAFDDLPRDGRLVADVWF